jgi:hypothetical protein
MLENVSWVKINNCCHALMIDENSKVLAMIYTPYDLDDGDENLIWDVEIEEESFGSYISLYLAKLEVQKYIAAVDVEMEKEADKKKKNSRKKAIKAKKEKSASQKK